MFQSLHQSGCFVIPNPWDPGSARYLAHLGFKALATTSAGFAFSRALADGKVPRDMMLRHIEEIVQATGLPVNADFESGYAHRPEDVAESVRMCVETGVAGLSIEDLTGDRDKPLFDLPMAADRIRAAREAADRSGSGILLTARAECYGAGRPEPLKESIERLRAYAEAGADVLYAPGLRKADEIRALVSELNPKPVNVLMSFNAGLTVSDLAALGVRRISTGSGLARAAWGGFMRAAKALKEEGSFRGFDEAGSFADLNGFFRGGA